MLVNFLTIRKLAVGYRSQSARFKDGNKPFKSFKNVVRVGPTVASFLRPVDLLVARYAWQYFTVVGYAGDSRTYTYGFPYMQGYSDAYDKQFSMNTMLTPFGQTGIGVKPKCFDQQCSERGFDLNISSRSVINANTG